MYIYIYIYFFFFHHTTCESTCNTLTSSAANQGDNTVLVAPGGIATPGAKLCVCVYIYIYVCVCVCVYIYNESALF